MIFALIAMLPLMKIGIVVPEWIAGEGPSKRVHNAAAKNALRNEADNHLKKRIPRHFEESGKSRYRMADRKPGYQKYKTNRAGRMVWMTNENGVYVLQRMSTVANRPLIRSGNTQRKIREGAQITTRGQLNRISATLKLKVPIPGGKTRRSFDLAAGLRLLAAGKLKKLSDRDRAEQRLDTIRRTVAEIEAIAADEVPEINRNVAADYVKTFNASRKVKIK